ncbi:MAG: FlgD immunoglobulin-like domain containing protein [Thermodesulfobacteriota bacterium]|nr:FlgD immunoglobulin-like domain containing protein [Thermodesulfobacteriota bacterium]
MTIQASGNSSLEALSSSYQARKTEEKEDTLGRQDFLTMLVTQLEHQDPLNPMEGSDFSAQLAQFSSLEQLMNLNKTMETMASAFQSGSSESDLGSMIGREVTGEVDAVEVADGEFFGGDYTISEPGDVMVQISDASGNVIRSLFPGQKSAGSYNINWDGTDNNGNTVADGSYKYSILVNSGYGYTEMPTTVIGKVDSIVYNEGKAYLQVNGTLVDPDSLVQVGGYGETEEKASSITDYLGKNITSTQSIAGIKGGVVSGDTCTFELEASEDIILSVFNQAGEEIRSIPVLADETSQGSNSVKWDGTDNSGNIAEDGLYLYSVSSASGNIETLASGEVSGIEYVNGEKYLVLKESNLLTGLSSVTSVN